MKVKTISYSKVFSLGNYENEKIGTEIEVEETDDIQKVIQKAREFVEYNHKLNGFVSELDQCQRVINNPDDFTGSQVRHTKERADQICEAINKGNQLMIEK
ncbi:MAG TPA: hypothetical protein PLC90_13915 [Bacteroidales bacterium]|nr:hypothetical protein [Bacteroidales bacterium]